MWGRACHPSRYAARPRADLSVIGRAMPITNVSKGCEEFFWPCYGHRQFTTSNLSGLIVAKNEGAYFRASL